MNAKRTRVLPRAARFLASPHRGAYRRRTESQERHACSSTPPPASPPAPPPRSTVAAGAAPPWAALLATVAHAPVARADAPAAHTAADCPSVLAGKARCYTGRDAQGAHYAIAVPTRWNGSLVVHAHGGPDLGEASDPARSTGDLERWAVMVKEGYAWAGSSYRRGGYGTRMAAADTESVHRVRHRARRQDPAPATQPRPHPRRHRHPGTRPGVLPRPGGYHWPALTAGQERAWSRIDGVGIAP